MRLYLGNKNRLYSYDIPSNIENRYIIEYHSINKEIKKIAIINKDDKLYINSSLNLNITINGKYQDSVLLDNNTCFNMHINDVDEDIVVFTYDINTKYNKYSLKNSISIGNSFNDIECPLLDINNTRIVYKDNKYYLFSEDSFVYINNTYYSNKELVLGDSINIYNIRIIFMNTYILISNNNNINIRLDNSIQSIDSTNKFSINRDIKTITNNEVKVLEPFYLKLNVEIHRKKNIVISIISIILFILSVISLLLSLYAINVNNILIKDEIGSLLISLILFILSIVLIIYSRSTANKDKTNYEEKFKNFSHSIKVYNKEYLNNLNKLYPNSLTIYKDVMNNNNIYYKDINNISFRIGRGRTKSNIIIDKGMLEYSEDSNMKERLDKLDNELYIDNVPIIYNLNKELNISFKTNKKKEYIDSLLEQIVTYYNPKELKIVIIYSEDNSYIWDDYRYIPHVISNNIRLIASNKDEVEIIKEYIKKNKNRYLILNDSNIDIDINEYIINFNSKKEDIIINGDKLIYKDREYNIDIDNINIKDIVTKLSNLEDISDEILEYKENILDIYKVGNIEKLDIKNKWNCNKKEVYIANDLILDLTNILLLGDKKEDRLNFIYTYLLSLSINYNNEDLQYMVISDKFDIDLPNIIKVLNIREDNEYYRFLRILENDIKDRKILLVIDKDNIIDKSYFINDLLNIKNNNLYILISSNKSNERLLEIDNKILLSLDLKEQEKIISNYKVLNNNKFYLVNNIIKEYSIPDIDVLYKPSNEYIDKNNNDLIFIDNLARYTAVVDNNTKEYSIKHYILEELNKYSKKIEYTYFEGLNTNIYLDDVLKINKLDTDRYSFKTILGMYEDTNEKVYKTLVLDLLKMGNFSFYGIDSEGIYAAIKTIVLSLCYYHSPTEIDLNIIDMNDSLYSLSLLPHTDLYTKNIDKVNNLLIRLEEEYQNRKKLLIRYDNDLSVYNKRTKDKLPLLLVIFNEYNIDEEYYDLLTNSAKYGIVIFNIRKDQESLSKYYKTIFATKFKDIFDYRYVLNADKGFIPKDVVGRGLTNIDNNIYEYQVSFLTKLDKIDDVIKESSDRLNKYYKINNRR